MWKFWKKPAIDPYHIPRKVRLEHVERMLGGLPAKSEHPSRLFFTVHKAASSFVGRMLLRIAVAQQMNPIDYEEYLNSERDDFSRHQARLILESVMMNAKPGETQLAGELMTRKDDELSRLFPQTGFHFGPIRNPNLLNELPELEQFRVLIQLRDPRDCLTSMYFSKAFSHVAPRDPEMRKRFFEDRRQVREASIDEHVLHNAQWWLELYQVYADAVQKSPQVRLVKYEDMVLNFPGWLNRVEQAWDCQIDPELRRELIAEASFDVKREDVNSHKRQVLPGDHLRKLQPETIRQLTDMFGPTLEALGYPPEAKYSRAA